MPKRKYHVLIDRIVLGRECNALHYILDFPSRFYGSKHRKFFHSLEEATLIGFLLYGKEGIISAWLHLLADNLESEIKKYLKSLGQLRQKPFTKSR